MSKAHGADSARSREHWAPPLWAFSTSPRPRCRPARRPLCGQTTPGELPPRAATRSHDLQVPGQGEREALTTVTSELGEGGILADLDEAPFLS